MKEARKNRVIESKISPILESEKESLKNIFNSIVTKIKEKHLS